MTPRDDCCGRRREVGMHRLAGRSLLPHRICRFVRLWLVEQALEPVLDGRATPSRNTPLMNEILAGRTQVIRECMVAIDEVVVNPGMLLRGLSERHVTHLAERWPLDPILLTENLTLLDGLHRLEAGRRLGMRQLVATVLAGDDLALLATAFAANCAPDLPLTAKQRAEAGRRLLEMEPGLSDRTIARILSISPTTVGRIRRLYVADGGSAPDRRVGLDGKSYSVEKRQAPLIGTPVRNGQLATTGVQLTRRISARQPTVGDNGLAGRCRQWWSVIVAHLRPWFARRRIRQSAGNSPGVSVPSRPSCEGSPR